MLFMPSLEPLAVIVVIFVAIKVYQYLRDRDR
jgi:hypothetical protein